MARVDFYILSNEGADEPLRVACRVAEKAWRQGHRVRVEAGDAETVRRLDTLMWTFKQESFLPHEVAGEAAGWTDMDPPPVQLASGGMAEEAPEVLVNLSGAVPPMADRCARIAEIVSADPAAKRAGRDRYRRYRERGFELETHQL